MDDQQLLDKIAKELSDYTKGIKYTFDENYKDIVFDLYVYVDENNNPTDSNMVKRYDPYSQYAGLVVIHIVHGEKPNIMINLVKNIVKPSSTTSQENDVESK